VADNNNQSRQGGGGARRPLNEMRRIDGGERQTPPTSIPAAIGQHYHQDANSYRSKRNNDRIEFVDRGSRMHGYNPVSAFTARSMVQIAEARGWKAVELTGVADWKSKAYVEATKRGMEVRGYEPTQKDAEILQRHADRVAAQSNPKVRAFIDSVTPEQMIAAAEHFPDLTNAFAVRAGIAKASEHMRNANDIAKQMWVGAMNDRLVLALHRGEPLPDVSIRQDHAAAQDAPDRDTSR
jgi:hypothetical protein